MTALAGQKAIVTGAAEGIGAAILARLRKGGAEAVGLDIAATGDLIACDVSDEAGVVAAVGTAIARLGGLDCVVNNAGIMLEQPLVDTPAADFDRVIAVNLRGTFLVAREAARHFLAGERDAPGRIINIASELAHLGRADYAPYCASKGGVISLTRSLAHELAPNILVNAVAPGPTDTAMLKTEQQYETLKATFEGIPRKRLGAPADIAGAVAFLASPEADFITGSVLNVNGGAAMY
ncbi:MAG: SDR family oxidoreductase [Pseudomonadota bacterium]